MAENRTKVANYLGIEIKFFDYIRDIDTDNVLHHVYLVNNKVTKSVTQILTEQVLAPEYPEDNPYVIKAQERGTMIHEECEKVFQDDNYIPLSVEAMWVKKNIKPMLFHPRVETLLFYKDIYAGQCDLFGQDKDGNYIIIDYKTGGYNKETVAWQLTLYYLALVFCGLIPSTAPVKFYVAVLRDKVEDCQLIELERIRQGDVNYFFTCLKDGKTYQRPFLPISVNLQSTFVENAELDTILTPWGQGKTTDVYDFTKKILIPWVKEVDEYIKSQLINSKQTRGQTIDGCHWAIEERMDTRLDRDGLKKDHPDIYNQYLKTKPTLCLKWKGKKAPKEKIIDEKAEIKEVEGE